MKISTSLLFISVLLAPFTGMSQALSGTFTIGGVNPDFPTFSAAIDTLNKNGISGEVRFNVRPGQYNEQIIIEEFPGSSCTTPVIFESETGDSTEVVLAFNGSFNANYVIYLNGADGIEFRNLTLSNTSNSYGRVISLNNGADCNKFGNNAISTANIRSSSYNTALVYSPPGQSQAKDSANVFQLNTFSNGSMGFYFNGPGDGIGERELGTVIENNRFINPYLYGLELNHQENIQFVNNVIVTNSTRSSIVGLLGNHIEGVSRITANKFILPLGNGIQLVGSDGFPDQYSLIANNFISIEGTSNATGISLRDCDYVNLLFNSIALQVGNSTESECLFLAGSQDNSFLTIQNNLFVNYGAGRSVYINSIPSNSTFDFNNYYTDGNAIGYWSGEQAELSDWQNATGMDQNSLSIDPLFTSVSDLHVSQIELNARGKAFSEVSTDFDGEIRDALTPDIGADEFSPSSSDVGVSRIVGPSIPFKHGLNEVSLILKNQGSTTLTSARLVFDANGQRINTNWTGSLASGDTIKVTIGEFNFQLGISYSFIAWADNPNGQVDTQAANDTAYVEEIWAGMEGVYTIGGITPNFSSISEAITSLNNGGIVGATTFRLRAGTYLEQFEIIQFPGSSCGNPVIFESERRDSSEVILRSNANFNINYIVRLNSADGITFRNLGFEVLNRSYGRVVEILNGASCNTFESCQFLGYEGASSTSSNNSLVYSPSGSNFPPDTANIFRNNLFLNGSFGILSYGPSLNLPERGNNYLNNIFVNQYWVGIEVVYQSDFDVSENSFESFTARDDYYGIYLENCPSIFEIDRNDLYIPNGGYGIWLQNCDAIQDDWGLVANNFVSIGGANDAYGIRVNGSQYHRFLSNSIYIYGTNPKDGFATYTTNNTRSSLVFLNNILANERGGYAHWIGDATMRSDYNCLYSTGEYIGAYERIDAKDLGEWQELSGEDSFSISVNPLFVSETNLHASQSSLNGAATPSLFVLTDIDGESRNPQTPDIGADEFDLLGADVGVVSISGPQVPFLHGENEVRIVIKNHGSNPLSSSRVFFEANGQQIQNTWTGSLASGDTLLVDVGTFSFQLGVAYELKAWASSPNGQSDVQPANDTAFVQNIWAGLEGEYTIGGVTPNFETISDAATTLNNGGVVGPTTFSIRSGQYNEQITISQFPGNSCDIPVVFESESGDSSDVVLTHASSFSANYTLLLSGADGVIIRNMTIQATNTSYGRVIYIWNGSDCNQFLNNRIVGIARNTTSENFSVIFSPRGNFPPDNHNTFRNNRIENGSTGLYYFGQSSSVRELGTTVENNIFEDNYWLGISALYQDSALIRNNRILSNTTYTGYAGLELDNGSNSYEILGNSIECRSGRYGVLLQNLSPAESNPGLVANNFISIGSTGDSYGIFSDNVLNTDIYHNSIQITSTDVRDGRAYYQSGGTNVRLKNNILYNKGGGYSIYVSSARNFESDYNNLLTTGSTLAYWSGNRSTLLDWQTASSQDANSLAVDPLFTSDTDLHTGQTALNEAGTPLPRVPFDIDGQPRDTQNPDIGADEFANTAFDLGISEFLLPQSGCGLSAAETVRVEIVNFSNIPQTGFQVAYQINNQSPVIESVGSFSIPPGEIREYTFSTLADLSQPRTYKLMAYTLLANDAKPSNDTLDNFSLIHYPIPQPVSNMLPADGATDLDRPIAFSWQGDEITQSYDLYLWIAGEERPDQPLVRNLTNIQYTYSRELEFGRTYQWQILSKTDQCDREGPIQTFTWRELPDLIVSDVSVPSSTVFSEQEISVHWSITNQGLGNTRGVGWSEYAYLSQDKVLDFQDDIRVGIKTNLSDLEPNQTYQQEDLTFTLPDGIFGDYYLFVWVDPLNRVIEVTDTNNVSFNGQALQVELSPSPDLQFLEIDIPGVNTFVAGGEVPVSWTVGNVGTAPTGVSSWTDAIYLSESPNFDFNQILDFRLLTHRGVLDTGEVYSNSTSLQLDQNLEGTYYIHGITDLYNRVGEFSFTNELEENNLVFVDSFTVVQNPLNLTVTDISGYSPTHSSNELVELSWITRNIGVNQAVFLNWAERVYVSNSPTYDASLSRLLFSRNYRDTIKTASEFVRTEAVRLPNNVTGAYYFHVIVDAFNSVFEPNGEDDNVGTSPSSFQFLQPDLIVSSLEIPELDNTGGAFTVSFTVENQGPGDLVDRSISNTIYWSNSPEFSFNDVQILGFASSFSSLGAGQSIAYTRDVNIPNDAEGPIYIFVYTDPSNNIFEHTGEGNNFLGDGPLVLALPDLSITSLEVPSVVNAGEDIAVSWTVTNSSSSPIPEQGWSDLVILTSSPIFNAFNTWLVGPYLHVLVWRQVKVWFRIRPSLFLGLLKAPII